MVFIKNNNNDDMKELKKMLDVMQASGLPIWRSEILLTDQREVVVGCFLKEKDSHENLENNLKSYFKDLMN